MLNCPRDWTEMDMMSQENINFAYCKTCHGIWMNEEDVLKAMKAENKKMKLFKLEPKKLLDEDLIIKCMICPETCLEKTEKWDITIDYCPKCKSIWFDGWELLEITERWKITSEKINENDFQAADKTTEDIAIAASSATRKWFDIIWVISRVFHLKDKFNP